MNKCAVVYTKNEKDCMEINMIDEEIEINKVFYGNNCINDAIAYVKKEVGFQLYNDDEWSANYFKKNDLFVVEICCCKELQYTMYIKEIKID